MNQTITKLMMATQSLNEAITEAMVEEMQVEITVGLVDFDDGRSCYVVTAGALNPPREDI